MEKYTERCNEGEEKYLQDLSSHVPEWSIQLVELYISTLKYEIIYRRDTIKDN